jgi:hypothetical protein
MAIFLVCPGCSKRLLIPEKKRNQLLTCPACGCVLGQVRHSASGGETDPDENCKSSSGARLATCLVLVVAVGLGLFLLYGRFAVWQERSAEKELAQATASEAQPQRGEPAQEAAPPSPEATRPSTEPARQPEVPPAPPPSEASPQPEAESSAPPSDPKPAAPATPVEGATASAGPAEQPVTKDSANASEPGKESAKAPEPEAELGPDRKSAQEPTPGTGMATEHARPASPEPNPTEAVAATPPPANGQQSPANGLTNRPPRQRVSQLKQWSEEELLRELVEMPDLAMDLRFVLGSAATLTEASLGGNPSSAGSRRASMPLLAPPFVVVSEAQARRQLPGWTEGTRAMAHAERANDIAAVSIGLRRALSAASGSRVADSDSSLSSLLRDSTPKEVNADRLRSELERRRSLWCRPEAVSSLCQILGAETKACRLVLVEALREIPGEEATAGLVRLALFDVAAPVRQAAIEALRSRPADSYRQQLLRAMRYPWLPVIHHAAEALVALEDKGAVPGLLELLQERSDPRALYPRQRQGLLPIAVPNQTALQEFPGDPLRLQVVKVNHLANCLLCHARADSNSGPLVAPVPVLSRSGGGSLDPRSAEYYSGLGGLMARADIVKLRQDFSATLTVPEQVPGPNQQRYDFLVLLRPMTAKEREQLAKQPEPPHHAPVLFALRELTGQDLGKDPAKWISHLRSTPEGGEGLGPGR